MPFYFYNIIKYTIEALNDQTAKSVYFVKKKLTYHLDWNMRMKVLPSKCMQWPNSCVGQHDDKR